MKQWALITGASRRIGAAIARQLHGQGYGVLIHYGQSYSDANALCSELNGIEVGSAISFAAQLDNETGINKLIERARQLPQLSLLINNASVFCALPLGKIDFIACQKMLAINTLAPYLLAQGLESILKKNHGSIINLLDIHSKKPLLDHGIYSASKAALEMLTLSLAQELAPKVRVNGIAPGAILWPESSSQLCQQAIQKKIPLQRCGHPDDIAKLVSFLASAPYITGQIIAVDGGRSATGFAGAQQ